MNSSVAALSSVRDVLEGLRAERESRYESGKTLGEDGCTLDTWPSGLTRERGEALREIVVRERAVRCVETGFALGLSASFVLEGSLTVRPESGAKETEPRLVSIDPFQTSQWHGAGRRLLANSGASSLHALLEERSDAALPRLLSQHRRFDLAFIDGDHRFEGVFLDIHFTRRLVGDGKLIVVDDAWMPAVRKAAAFFESAGLCRRDATPEGSALGKFILLRVDARGDGREWDHFVEF